MRGFVLPLVILGCISPAFAQSGDSIPFLSRYGYAVELSPRLDELWPGGKHWNIRLWDIRNEVESENWDKVVLVVVEGDTLYDDGLHLDGEAHDLLYGYFSLDSDRRFYHSPTGVFIWLSDGNLRGWIDALEEMEAGPLESFPEPVSPPIGGTVNSTKPTFHWQSVEGAEGYGFILWDRMPSPERFRDDIIWEKGDIPGDTTSASIEENGTKLEYGKTYFWAIWAVNTTQKPHEGFYAGTYPYYVMDIGWFRVEKVSGIGLETWGRIKMKLSTKN